MLLEKKVALVTGAGSGIGLEIAVQCAAAGASVIVSDIQDKHGLAAAQRITAAGGHAAYVKADVSKPADSEALVQEAVRRFGALHIAVNNAGIAGPMAPVGEYPIDGWDKVIAVNLSGIFYGMRYQLDAIKAAGGGAIVNISSILGQVGYPGAGAYVAAKHGIVGLTRTAALEYAPHKVRVNVVGPAFIRTPLIENILTPEVTKALEEKHPVGRLGEPSEVAELVVWLCSDKASFVTGSYYAVDGGYLAQ